MGAQGTEIAALQSALAKQKFGPAGASSYRTITEHLAVLARTNAARFDLATDGLAKLVSSGLTTTGGYIAASTGGTDGNAVFPNWNPNYDFRASFRVKVTKATVGSKSYVGFTTTEPGVLPSPTTYTYGVGYLQGTGLVIIKENVGAATVILADASLVDGAEYDVSLHLDYTLQKRQGSSTTGLMAARVTKVSDGSDVAGTPPGINYTFQFYLPKNVLVRTNVAAGAITNLKIALHPEADVDKPSALAPLYTPLRTSDTAFLHVPAKSNGKLVIACHGHGGGAIESGWNSALYRPTWDALVAAGFTVAVPDLGGDLWGNDFVQQLLADLHAALVDLYDLDRECYLWGNSMGGGASLTAIAKKTVPVRAAYLAQPAVDLSALWANPSYATLPTAYGNSVAERDDNSPLVQPASAYAGVPMLFVASAADTAVPKAAHTDALRTKLGSTVPNYLIVATGNHNDQSMFRAQDTLNFFRANL